MNKNPQHGSAALILLFVVLLVGVAVAAYYYSKGNLKLPVITQTALPSAQISPTRTPVANETANWKTYTNTAVGFTVQYPPDFGPPELVAGAGDVEASYADGSEKNTNILFIKSGSSAIELSVFPFSGALKDLVADQSSAPYTDGDLPKAKVKDLKIGGRDAVWYKTDDDRDGFEVFFTGKNYGFIVDYKGDPGYKKPISENVVDQILSTFKFTN